MAWAMMLGAGAGAVHAVTGPDHVLSLAPLALDDRRAWRLGLRWGVGHSLGTLLLALPFVLLLRALDLDLLATWGERLAGAALLAMAAWSAWGLWRQPSLARPEGAEARGVLALGFLHGVTGAAGVLLGLPGVGAEPAWMLAFLLTFSVGSAAAMAGLTGVLATAGRRVTPQALQRARMVGVAAAAVLGGVWVV